MKIMKANHHHIKPLLDLLKKIPIYGRKDVLVHLIGTENLSHSIEAQNFLVTKILEQDNSTIFIAEEDNMFVGYLIVLGGFSSPAKHVAHVFIGVLENYHRRGIGTQLFIELERWARANNIYRLELLVVSSNKPAISLFQKKGFKIEGLKRNSLKVGGHYFHEYIMAKILD